MDTFFCVLKLIWALEHLYVDSVIVGVMVLLSETCVTIYSDLLAILLFYFLLRCSALASSVHSF